VLRVWERYTKRYGVGMTHESHGDVVPGIPRIYAWGGSKFASTDAPTGISHAGV